jgi:hypothetical protein
MPELDNTAHSAQILHIYEEDGKPIDPAFQRFAERLLFNILIRKNTTFAP